MTLKNFSTEMAVDLHGPITPADVRDGEQVRAKIRSLENDVFLNTNIKVWRISPLGIELCADREVEVKKGLHIELDIYIGFQKTTLTGLIVDQIEDRSHGRMIYVRLVPQDNEKGWVNNKRDASRWICSDQFYPTAVASNPAKFNDFIYFKVRDISFGGFKLYTSLRNKFIIPGLVLDCIVNFPMVAQIRMKISVKNVRVELENGREVLAVGVTFDASNREINQTVGSYVAQFGSSASLKEIQGQGFDVFNISDSVTYSYVKSREEFDEVLKLRYLAYREAGKVDDSKTYQDMSDVFDSKSRIVIGTYKGEVVSTARLIFHQLGERMEQESFVTWPQELPRQDEVVEIMRACTHPDFRGSDLLLGMFKFMAVTVAQAKKRWIVICATDEMVQFYKKIGFKSLGLSYEHKTLNNKLHHVMIANFIDGLTGKTVSPIYWNLVWRDSTRYLASFDLIEIDPFMQIRLTIFNWFRPIADFFFYKKLKRRVEKIRGISEHPKF